MVGIPEIYWNRNEYGKYLWIRDCQTAAFRYQEVNTSSLQWPCDVLSTAGLFWCPALLEGKEICFFLSKVIPFVQEEYLLCFSPNKLTDLCLPKKLFILEIGNHCLVESCWRLRLPYITRDNVGKNDQLEGHPRLDKNINGKTMTTP